MTALIETKSLNKHFGALHATRDVTFTLEEGARWLRPMTSISRCAAARATR